MSGVGHKCKHLVEVTMIPLNGIHPIMYNLEMDLLATTSELKKDIIKLMTKHNQRMRDVSNFYFKQIQQSISKDAENKTDLFIIPIEIIDLCWSFYDEYYPMSVNIQAKNLAVLAQDNHNYKVTDEWISDDDMPLYEPSQSDPGVTKPFNVYELLDDEILNKLFNVNKYGSEYEVIRIFHEYQTLVMKLPHHVVINS
eukprot:878931_1